MIEKMAQDRDHLLSADRRKRNSRDRAGLGTGAARSRGSFFQFRVTSQARALEAADLLSSGDRASYSLFPYPDYTLPLAVKMAKSRGRGSSSFSRALRGAARDGGLPRRANARGVRTAPKIVTTLHGTDTTLLGQDPTYRAAIEHALSHSDAVTAVSESLRAGNARDISAPSAG